MVQPVNEDTQPIRIPAVTPMESRNADFIQGKKDGRLINCYVENRFPNRKIARKRPGFARYASYTNSLWSQGLTYFKSRLYAVSNNSLYRLGAAIGGFTTGGAWTNPGPVTFTGRHSSAYCVFKGRMFILGGVIAGNSQNDVWSSSDGINWAQVALSCPWGARSAMQVAVLNDTMYLMGGVVGGNFVNDVWSSPDGVNWTQLTGSAAWAGLSGFSLISFNNLLWILGGTVTGPTYKNDIWSSADGITWSKNATAPGWSARAAMGLAVFNNKAWLVGGYSGVDLNDVWSSADGITWTQATAAAFATARNSVNVLIYNGKMYAVGGVNTAAASYKSDVYSSTDGATWTLVTSAPGWSGRIGPAFVFSLPTTIDTNQSATMWFIGGYNGADLTDVWYANINGSSAVSWAIPTTGAVTDKFSFTNANRNQYLFFKNSTSAFVLDGDTVTKITDSNYPSVTVPGVVELNGTVYVMDPDGTIYGSDLNYPTVFPALNFITAEYQPDRAVALTLHDNYIIAFKSTTTEFFYDAGNPDGSPLSPVINATMLIGCADARSIAIAQDSVFFMGQSLNTSERAIYQLDGLKANMVSTPFVNRLLEELDLTIGSWGAAIIMDAGQAFYVISTSNYKYSIVYHINEQVWYLWAWGVTGGFIPIKDSATDGVYTYIQDNAAGTVYYVTTFVKSDNFAPITCEVQTAPVDLQNMRVKKNNYLELVGDMDMTAATNPVNVSFTDDDYNSFIGPFQVDMNQKLPRVSRLGMFRRRAYKITHTSASLDFGLEALEAWIDQGTA